MVVAAVGAAVGGGLGFTLAVRDLPVGTALCRVHLDRRRGAISLPEAPGRLPALALIVAGRPCPWEILCLRDG